MESPRVHFVRFAGEIRGPLAVEHLRDLADVGAITPDTEVGANASGPWTPLRTQPFSADVFPAKAAMGFREKEIETLNRPSAPAVDLQALIQAASVPGPVLRGREVVVTPQTPRAVKPAAPLNDVQLMVREVGAKIAAHEPPVTHAPRPKPFPRWKWFALPSLVGTPLIWTIPWFYGQAYAGMTLNITLGWTVLFNALLVALMVLDARYRNEVGEARAKIEKDR